MKTTAILLTAILAGGAMVLVSSCEESGVARDLSSADAQWPVEGTLPALDGATGWINTAPLTPQSLRGKVVLVDFWTYTCINWQRTAPWIRHWADKYKDAGLVVLGVHSPEFQFEKDPDRVLRSVTDMRLHYPIAVDSHHAIWRAFGNQYWPALYVVDAQGRIRHHVFGEGNYEQTETVIRQLLQESGARTREEHTTQALGTGAEAEADWANLKSPENYVGYQRTERFASPGGSRPGVRHVYGAPSELKLNHWALRGEWTMGAQFAASNAASGSIGYRFHARDLHLVMGSGAQGKPVRFRVFVDGQAPGMSHGVDVNPQGYGSATEYRLYQLVRQPAPIVDREFEIEFLDSGIEVFAFTFG